jgi:hypothetical protein
VEGTGPPVRETVESTRIVAFTDSVFAVIGRFWIQWVPGRLRHRR